MKLVLHIGTEKTGTTSIQAALAADRDSLTRLGILYPRLLGAPNHCEVYVASTVVSEDNEIALWEMKRTGLSINAYRDACRLSLKSELATGDFHTILISNEHFHSRIHSRDGLERAMALLGVDLSSITIIVYLRRQDKLATSVYSTRLQLGDTGDVFDLLIADENPNYFNYDRLLRFYEETFGRSNIVARLYETRLLKSGDVVSDFYETVGLGISPASVSHQNVSITAAEAIFLQHFNAAFPLLLNGPINNSRGPISEAISGVSIRQPFRPLRRLAESFLPQFTAGNAWVRQRYFPNLDRLPLFDDDMSSYPISGTPDLTTAEMMKFVVAIWDFAGRERAWLMSQLEDCKFSLAAVEQAIDARELSGADAPQKS